MYDGYKSSYAKIIVLHKPDHFIIFICGCEKGYGQGGLVPYTLRSYNHCNLKLLHFCDVTVMQISVLSMDLKVGASAKPTNALPLNAIGHLHNIDQINF